MPADRQSLINALKDKQVTGSRRVKLTVEASADFDRVEERRRTKLETHFENFGKPGTTLPEEAFVSEGRFPTGRSDIREVQVFVFKAFQTRLYGVRLHIDNCDTFIGFEMDKKKRNRADQKLLKRVAKKAAPYLG